MLRKDIKEKCEKFVLECRDKKKTCEDINFYDVLEWQNNLINNAEVKFRTQILEYQSWCGEQQEGKAWLEEQYTNIKTEYDKLQSWCDELQQSKAWLEEQYNNIKEENEKMRNWCNELQQGKTWIEGQYDNIKEEKAKLQSWCEEQQEEKTWLEEQYNNVKTEYDKLQKWCEEQQKGKGLFGKCKGINRSDSKHSGGGYNEGIFYWIANAGYKFSIMGVFICSIINELYYKIFIKYIFLCAV